jgi:hypothetical protein
LLERPSGLPNNPKGPHQFFRAAHVATAGAAHPGERLKLRRASVASIRQDTSTAVCRAVLASLSGR